MAPCALRVFVYLHISLVVTLCVTLVDELWGGVVCTGTGGETFQGIQLIVGYVKPQEQALWCQCCERRQLNLLLTPDVPSRIALLVRTAPTRQQHEHVVVINYVKARNHAAFSRNSSHLGSTHKLCTHSQCRNAIE